MFLIVVLQKTFHKMGKPYSLNITMWQVNSFTSSNRILTISSKGDNCNAFMWHTPLDGTNMTWFMWVAQTKKLNKIFYFGHRYNARHNNMTSTEPVKHFINNHCTSEELITVHILFSPDKTDILKIKIVVKCIMLNHQWI